MLENKTVFLTGGGGGIGSETARTCANAGARVIVTDIDGDAAQSVADELTADGYDAVSHELDVTDPEQFSALVSATADEYGLDAIVNNAGIGHDAAVTEAVPLADRDRVMDVNIRGVWNGTRAALPIMKEQGSGSIVNVSSLAAIVGLPKQAVYSLSKGAVVSFTRAVAAEAGRAGVRANAICPGFIDTGVGAEYFDESDDPDRARQIHEQLYPLGRLGEASEVATVIRFLASEESSYMTGNAVRVDGGYSIS
ncbi:SDR family NAD(P)-dependent oxidoreductase [Halocatena halophila]|uniref:SDR family NAD(P)-dependent oxidoreductase n=1 Tax=Halocatena halophila TaxID=2814576 RepID=UPI002ED58738